MYVFLCHFLSRKELCVTTLYMFLFIVTGILSCFDACFVHPKMLFILFFHILQHLMTSFLSDVAESEASEYKDNVILITNFMLLWCNSEYRRPG